MEKKKKKKKTNLFQIISKYMPYYFISKVVGTKSPYTHINNTVDSSQ